MKTVFFYGLFMDPFLLRDSGLTPTNCRRAFLDDYQLVIGEKATLKPLQGARAYGTLMELEDIELEELYASEGVTDYIPVEVELNEHNGSRVNACTYILSTDKISGTNVDYARRLVDVLRNMKFPESYIEEVENWKK